MQFNQVSDTFFRQKITEISSSFREFILTFQTSLQSSQSNFNSSLQASSISPSHYLQLLQETISSDEELALTIDFEHITEYSPSLASGVESDFLRVEPHLRSVLAAISQERFPESSKINSRSGVRDRRFPLHFSNIASPTSLRHIDCEKIGSLLVVKGVVTRTSDVKPELIEGVFRCTLCDKETTPLPSNFRFTTPKKCSRRANEATGEPACPNTSAFELVPKKSIFSDWQRVSVQEDTADVPPGSVPRTLDIILRGELVEKTRPGDLVTVPGALVAVPEVAALYSDREISRASGARAVKAGAGGGYGNDGKIGVRQAGPRSLSHRLVFLSFGPTVSLTEAATSVSESEMIDREAFASEAYRKKVIASIAPDVAGLDDIKRGVLLLLLGGVSKTTPEGIALRGNVNILLVGDPSTAKSRLLNEAARLSPRAVYSSGKGSTAAGLTASVVRDEDSGDYVVQAGAMMLADGGVCCLDEFDKMDAQDTSAIHEAMEQQTITITKAGIHATMNAKTSVMAACNPVSGRYDRSKPLFRNLNLTAPILSRFDLIFVLLDEGDKEKDLEIARSIVRGRAAATVGEAPGEVDVQRFVETASRLKPVLGERAQKLIVSTYRSMRESDSVSVHSNRTTVRQLESLIRLSEATAKFHLSEVVEEEHVVEASKLLRKSITMVSRKEIVLPAELSGAAAGEEGERRAEVKISFEEYRKICNSISLWLRLQSEGKEENEIVQWYVAEMEKKGNLKSNEETIALIRTTKKVVERLNKHDNVLIASKEDGRIKYSLNPNFDIEENPEVEKNTVRKVRVKKDKLVDKDAYDFED